MKEKEILETKVEIEKALESLNRNIMKAMSLGVNIEISSTNRQVSGWIPNEIMQGDREFIIDRFKFEKDFLS